ncbi:MAG: ABC transporter permease [SAR86 cluster bacterium]|uniref:ABC transporter permease n=1 Tax=SAR86 cluster bacterium TaxID=2030880 RepID=A0A2A4X3Q9_9GAMM|nr:MAG: ABC transporter permease [SAR86 cluster bacterium]
MIKNYLLVAIRNLFSNKLFSAINLVGLSIGIACVIMISLFVINETSYDKHWEKSDRIYRVMRTLTIPDGSPDLHLAANAPQVGPLLQQDFPEIESAVRMYIRRPLVSTPGSNDFYYEGGVYYADEGVHEIFDIPMLYGQWEGALTSPYEIVLSETLASKYFADSNPVGETLLFNGDTPYVVTGVMADLVQESHMAPRAFASFATQELNSRAMSDWGNNSFYTYILTEESYDIQQLVDLLPEFLDRHLPEQQLATRFTVMPVTDIHLRSQREGELATNGNAVLVAAFAAIALLILAIACFNFMNLSTARSMARADEIGMRKVFGATRSQLMIQFLGESILLSLLAVSLAVGISDLLLPLVNNILGLELTLGLAENYSYLAYFTLLAIVVGILAGSYPAFYMADFPLSSVLKGELETGAKGETLRKSLVIVQFTISIVLIIASGIAFNQIRYVLNLELGLNTEKVAIYRGNSIVGMGSQYQTMKQELLRHPNISSVTAANMMPSNQNNNLEGFTIEGDGSQPRMITPLNVDYDFFSTFDIQVISGRDFSPSNSADMWVEVSRENPHTTGGIVLNESAVRQLGWTPENAIGRSLEVWRAADAALSVQTTVIGVTEDILFSSVREEVKPTYYRLRENNNLENTSTYLRQLAVKYSGENPAETLAYIESIWQQFMPGVPIVQSFLEQNYAGLYQNERTQGNVFTLFSVVAIFVAILGLFGLASYLTELRTKEIGIRKVLGSTVLGIVSLLSKDFCKLVVIANVLAWPIAWYVMNAWLQGFVYRAEISPSIFVTTAIATLLMAFLTVGSLAAVTANRNPIRALRQE